MFDSSRKYWFDKNDDSNTQRRKKQRFIRNQITGLDFEREMFEQRKSYRVLFITLNADKKYRGDVGFITMQGYRRRLFQRIKDAHAYARKRKSIGKPLEDYEHSIFHDIHGLLWRQEQGDDDGGAHHLHLIVFVSRRDHVTACEELGMAWQRITKGWGYFHNANRYAYSYRNRWGVALGYVHRNDDEKRCALQKLIGLYIAKASQTPAYRDEDGKLHGVRRFD